MMCEKRVRIGNQTASSAETLREPFDYAVENGFDAFEWFLDTSRSGDDWAEAEPGPEELREIGRLFQEVGGAELHGLDRCTDLVQTGDHQHLDFRVRFLDAS